MKNIITLATIIAISIQAYAQKTLESFEPVLKSTLDKSIKVSYEKGYAIEEVKPNIYVLTDGIWQSAAIVTTDGVVLIDAPESFGTNIEKAVKEVTNEPIKTLVYTHGHSDHIGGSQHLSNIKDLEIISLTGVADFLREQNDSRRLIPNRTFEGALVLKKGNKQIHLSNHMNYHSNEGDLFVSVPQDKFLMVIDVLAPGYVPFKNLDLSNNVHNYLKVFDQILAYDFDVFIGGHLTGIGSKDDVLLTKAYVNDLYETVKRIHSSTNMLEVMSAAAEKIGWDNKYLLFDTFLNKVIDDSYKEIKSRWITQLAGVDVFTKSHISTMLNYVRWDD
jgi:glyoxylase-like metal-dependent hydrolase (beta-lactamase superfamily II)